MADDFTAVDTASEPAGLETPDLSTDTSSPDLGTETTETETPGEAPKGPAGKLMAGNQPSPAFKAELDKVENAEIKRAMIRDAAIAERLRKEIPGGFREVQQLRERIEELGGDEGISSTRAELDGWNQFDEMYTSGDPKVLEFLTETPEAKSAFLKIAPMAFEKYREAHPEGYNSYVAQVFEADMAQNEVPMTVALLGHLLGRVTFPSDGDRAEAEKLYKSLSDYTNRIRTIARTPVKAPEAAKPTDDGRSKDLETQLLGETRTNWSTEANANIASPLFRQAWAKNMGGRNLKEAETARFIKYYKVNLQEVLGRKADFTQKLDGYLSGKQKSGFMKHYQAVYSEAVPLAFRQTMAELQYGKPGPKPAAAATTPAKPARTPQGKPDAGYALVAAKPEMSTVNRRQTTPDMWIKHQAILANGKKVSWR